MGAIWWTGRPCTLRTPLVGSWLQNKMWTCAEPSFGRQRKASLLTAINALAVGPSNVGSTNRQPLPPTSHRSEWQAEVIQGWRPCAGRLAVQSGVILLGRRGQGKGSRGKECVLPHPASLPMPRRHLPACQRGSGAVAAGRGLAPGLRPIQPVPDGAILTVGQN